MLLRHLPKDFRKLLLENVSHEISAFLIKVLNYPEGTVGAIMEHYPYTFYEDVTTAEALKWLKKQEGQNLHYIYILSRSQQLSGVLTINELFRSKPDKQLGFIMTNKVIKIFADTKYKSILDHIGWHNFNILPVVNNSNIFLGLVRYRELDRLEQVQKQTRLNKNLISASIALGELYRLGITGLIRGANEIYSETVKKI
jgi:Mg/Co/Ni transporter MgtE